jgi:hypothetical protein
VHLSASALQPSSKSVHKHHPTWYTSIIISIIIIYHQQQQLLSMLTLVAGAPHINLHFQIILRLHRANNKAAS